MAVRLLGRGTFGEAWLVVSKASGRFYVMKEMVTVAWENKDKEQAMNEVNILASCNHVNIVRYAGAYIVHKSLVTEKILIIMEYADAGDLAATIKRQKERRELIPEAQVISWFVQITFVLQYIHKKNILHRPGHHGNRNEMCTLQLAFPAENFMSLVQSICRGTYKPISSQYEEKVSDLIQVLLRPVPDRRPAAEQLLTCSKLETEVAAYLEYIEALKRTGRTESVSSSSGNGGSAQGSQTQL